MSEIVIEYKIKWRLQKYARQLSTNSCSSKEWKHFEGDLFLSLTNNNHLMITQKNTILENFSLWNANQYIKAVHKGDSMLIVQRFMNDVRKIRVKFDKSGSKDEKIMCQEAVTTLKEFFKIQDFCDENQNTSKGQISEECELKGEVYITDMKKILSSELLDNLPLAYSFVSDMTKSEDLDSIIRLCLTDFQFPSFVEKVQKQLDKISNE